MKKQVQQTLWGYVNVKKNKTYYEKIFSVPGLSRTWVVLFENALWAKEENGWDDNKYTEFLLKGISKIVELWSLSYEAERTIIKQWLTKPIGTEGFHTILNNKRGISKKKVSDKPLKLFKKLKTKSPELESEILISNNTGDKLNIKKINKEIKKAKAIIQVIPNLNDEHLYIDVTTIDYKSFIKSFKGIGECRKALHITKSDMKKGAPSSIDIHRAFLVAELRRRGLTRKEIANELGFKIYTQDNPSGSHPLYYKYLKIGKDYSNKMHQLEYYLRDLAGLSHEGEY